MTKYLFSIVILRNPVERVEREFAAIDVKGRRFGAQVRISEETRTETEGAPWLSEWVGTKFCVEPSALRGGEPFGAYAGARFFDTRDQAYAWVEKYFAEAEKRAVKNKARAA